MIQLVLIDDHNIFRECLVARLQQEVDFDVAADAATYDEALEVIENHHPDVVITDLTLRGARGGLDLIQACASRSDETNFLALSMHHEDIYAERVINAGGAGYLTKNATGEEVAQAVRAIHSGSFYLSPTASSSLLERLCHHKGNSTTNPVSLLSNRELDVFTAIGNRLNTKQIASDLDITTKAVEALKDGIRKKLGIADSYQLFIHAYEHFRSQTHSEPLDAE